MHSEGFEQWFKLNKNLTSPLGDWGRAVTEICRRTAQQNLEIAGENFARVSNQLRRLGNVKKPEDFVSLQKDCINENISATIENIQLLMQLSMENFEELTKLAGASLRDPLTRAVKTAEREKEKHK